MDYYIFINFIGDFILETLEKLFFLLQQPAALRTDLQLDPLLSLFLMWSNMYTLGTLEKFLFFFSIPQRTRLGF